MKKFEKVQTEKLNPKFAKENFEEFLENYKNLYKVLCTSFNATSAVHHDLKRISGQGYYIFGDSQDSDMHFGFVKSSELDIEEPFVVKLTKATPEEIKEIADVETGQFQQIAEYFGEEAIPYYVTAVYKYNGVIVNGKYC